MVISELEYSTYHATDAGHGCSAPTPSILSYKGARMRPKKDIHLSTSILSSMVRVSSPASPSDQKL
jgi:hypothetical protein